MVGFVCFLFVVVMHCVLCCFVCAVFVVLRLIASLLLGLF